MRWHLGLVTALVGLLAAVPCGAKIILTFEPDCHRCGLTSFTVSAVATEGELIAEFDEIRLMNAHQVFTLGDDDTPNIDNAGGFGWNDEWTAFDSHVLVPRANMLGSVGAPLEETNDGSTTGMVGLPRELGMSPPSGFGTLASSDGTDGFRLLPGLQSSSVEFLQVVSDRGGSFLSLSVAASLPGGQQVMVQFDSVFIVSSGLEPPPDGGYPPVPKENCFIPEPVSACLMMLALVGVAGWVRFRRPQPVT